MNWKQLLQDWGESVVVEAGLEVLLDLLSSSFLQFYTDTVNLFMCVNLFVFLSAGSHRKEPVRAVDVLPVLREKVAYLSGESHTWSPNAVGAPCSTPPHCDW